MYKEIDAETGWWLVVEPSHKEITFSITLGTVMPVMGFDQETMEPMSEVVQRCPGCTGFFFFAIVYNMGQKDSSPQHISKYGIL